MPNMYAEKPNATKHTTKNLFNWKLVFGVRERERTNEKQSFFLYVFEKFVSRMKLFALPK